MKVTCTDENVEFPRAILQLSQVTKRFHTHVAVNNLDLTVYKGDIFGILGPNGSGKTTTLRMVIGNTLPTAGEIYLLGQRMSDRGQRRNALRRTGALIEQPTFYPYLSGFENLCGVAVFAGLSTRSRSARNHIYEILERVDLLDHAKEVYRKYSLGMKQRLGIAAALLNHPDFVVLDEPTNGLDPVGVREVRKLIVQLSQQGVTIVIASHLLHEIQQICNRVAVLKAGQVLAQGPVCELLAAHHGIEFFFSPIERREQALSILQEHIGQPSWLRAVKIDEAATDMRQEDPDRFALLVDAPAHYSENVVEILATRGIYAAEVRRKQISLEDFFMSLVEQNKSGETSKKLQEVSHL